MTLEERLGSRLERITESGCWIWTAGIASNGYGMLDVNGRHQTAHRVMYELYFGKIPPGMWVLHRCDARSCVSPHHLYLGTAKDNTRDALMRNRLPTGERSCKSKLKTEDIIAIQQLQGKVSCFKVAAEYNLHFSTVCRIWRRETWRHVQ